MFEVYVSVALLLLIVGIFTLLARQTQTRDAIWTNQRLLYEIINEQKELRSQIQLTVTESRQILERLDSIDELIGSSRDQVIDVQKNLTKVILEELD